MAGRSIAPICGQLAGASYGSDVTEVVGIPGQRGGYRQVLDEIVLSGKRLPAGSPRRGPAEGPLREGPTCTLVLVVGHYQFDSGAKICFAPIVFAPNIEGVISYLGAKR